MSNLAAIGESTRAAYVDCEAFDPRVAAAYHTSRCTNKTPPIPQSESAPTVIKVVPKDTIQAAIAINASDQNAKIGVLNFASNRVPGGGFLKSAAAQEEQICRQSTLWKCLKEHQNRFYPLQPGFVITSPDVFVFRYGADRDWKWIPFGKCFFVTMFSASAIRQPKLVNDDYTARDRSVMTATIKELLRAAYLDGVTHLILGAWGCGVFGHPPQLVAKMFADILLMEEFKNKFREIHFAVIDMALRGGTRGAPTRPGLPSNFAVFEKTFADLDGGDGGVSKN